jgi:hypothetical protein
MGVDDGELFSLEARVRALLRQQQGQQGQQGQQQGQQQLGAEASHSKASGQQGGICLVAAAGADSLPQ